MKDTVKKVVPASWWSMLRLPVWWWNWLKSNYRRNHCPVDLLWFKTTNDSCDLAHIHRLAFKRNKPMPRKDELMFTVMWPFLSTVRAAVFAWRYGKNTRRNYGIGIFSQWIQMVYLANLYNIALDSYYKFRLWYAENRKCADRYIQRHEGIALMRWLNRGINTDRLDNKVLFLEASRHLNISTAPAIVVFDGKDEERWYTESGRIPHTDVFVKLTDQCHGLGVEAWDYDHEHNTWTWNDTTLNEHQLLERWRERAKHEELIIHPRLKNHPSVAKFSNYGLCTLRAVTYFTAEMTNPEFLISTWRMPVGTTPVDSFSGGGIAASVSESGHLSSAVGIDVSLGTHSHHPSTNTPILDEKLPQWQEMVELALMAHEKFREPYFIGWDIALTEKGPVVIEGNIVWSADLVQMPQNQPLGETKFVELFGVALATLDSAHGCFDVI